MARSVSQPGVGQGGTRFAASDAETDQPAEELGPGSVIDGKYRLDRLLGEGGMGTVWGAQHLQLDLSVAIKLLRAGADKAALSERLKVEARAVARLSHPAIVRVFDVDTSEAGDPYIVMELLEGESLSDVLDRGHLSAVLAVQTLLPIAEGLALAHAKGIVHRDLKPQNVFIVRDGDSVQPKLLDFGIAKLTTPLPTGSLTDTGIVVGSPDYMSPEQARGRSDVDFRADIWQFCVVLYESLTGSTPFAAENYNALMRAIVEDEPKPLPLDRDVDLRLSELVAWGLSKDRSQRPASIQELARALSEWLLGRGVSEDITGAPLVQKWRGRASQRSLPQLVPETVDAPALPLPVRTDTLESPRFRPAVAGYATPEIRTPNERVAPRRLGRWAAAGVLVLLVGGLSWTLARQTPARESPVRVPSSRTTTEAPAEARAPIQLAPTAPEPSSAGSTSAGPALNTVPPPTSSVRSSKSSSAPASKASAAPVATKPPPDRHDETRELLQAY